MSEENKSGKRCFPLPPHPNVMPSWGCCNCRTLNGNQRTECKHCKHKRCDLDPANQVS